jgi:hypothetical protein
MPEVLDLNSSVFGGANSLEAGEGTICRVYSCKRFITVFTTAH